MRTANHPVLAEFSYDIMSMTASWRFTGWTFGDNYLISLSDAVTDVEGNRLDGEWTNPTSITTVNALVSEFPSGNGTAGGNFNFVATLLPGDANLDLIVDAVDFTILAGHYGNGQFDELFSEADFNGDGVVNVVDLALLSSNYGSNLQNLWLLADLNGDWVVNEDDVTILYNNRNLATPTLADGDLDANGDIDIHDLEIAFAQYGLELNVAS